jgi:hypothetical protein
LVDHSGDSRGYCLVNSQFHEFGRYHSTVLRLVQDLGVVSGLEEKYPWPQEGDDLFALDPDWHDDACLNFFRGDEPWIWMADGYKLAGDLSVAYVERTGRHQDKLVYPAMFNYRQYLELSLKGIVRDARRLFDEEGGAPRGHVLMELWRIARPLLFRLAPGAPELDLVGGCIARFNAIDPTSQGFRYPVTTGGRRALPARLTRINLSQARDVVERLEAFFGAIDMEIQKQEYYKSDASAAAEYLGA